MTVERNQELSRAAEWLNRAYLCITDASGKRRRNVELLDGRPISELPEAYHVARKEIDEEFRGLLLQLQDHVIPDVEPALPDSVEALTGLGERMLELRIAIYRPGSESDQRGKNHELLEHLAIEHRRPDYKAEIVAAVGECRAAWREADQAVRRESEPKTNAERDARGDQSPSWGVGRPSAKGRIMTEHKRRIQFRKAHDKPEPSVLEEAEALLKLDEMNFAHNDILTPSIDTIKKYIYEHRKSQNAVPKLS